MRTQFFIWIFLTSLHTNSALTNDTEDTSLLTKQATHETITINSSTSAATQISYATKGSFENCLLSARTGAQIGTIIGVGGSLAQIPCILFYETCFSPLARSTGSIGGISVFMIGVPVAGAIVGASLGALMSRCCAHAKDNP